MSSGAVEVVLATAVLIIFGANNYGCGILWVCFLMSMRSVQRELITNSCNFIVDWTIVLGKISIAGLALAMSQLATTDLPEHSHQPGPDFIFPKSTFGKKRIVQGSFQHSWFSKWPFLHYKEAEDTVFCHTCMKMFKEKKNKTYTKQILLL